MAGQAWTRFGGALLVITLMFAAFWLFYLRLMQPPEGVYRIDHMRFIPNNDAISAGAPRALPDDWLQQPGHVLAGSYRAELPPDLFLPGNTLAPARLLAVYLPVVHMNTDVYLDGQLLGRSHYFVSQHAHGDPYARESARPLYFLIPETLQQTLDDGGEAVSLRIDVQVNQPGSGLLGPVYVGDHERLYTAWQNRYRARVTTVQVITAGMLTIAIFMTVLWWLRREDSVYGWFALLVYSWSLHNLFFLGTNTPLPAPLEDWASLASLGWFVVFMAITTHRYLDIEAKRLEKAIITVAIAATVLLALANVTGWLSLTAHRIWSTGVLLLGGYSLLRVTLAYGYREDLKNPLVPAGGLSILLLGTHDWLLIMGWLPRDGGLLVHLSAPITLVTFASLLLERFTGVLRTAESLNLELEQRVADKHRELQANFEKMRVMENRQVLAEERERFMKEMHDGVGGHLIAMLSMLRSGENDKETLTRAIEAALSDLRIMIDSLDPNEHDIPALLGAMRQRLEPQLARSNMRFDWQVEEIPPLPDFGPRKALQVMRILQEAITNIINHADARRIRIGARVDRLRGQDYAVLDVIDDGRGFDGDISHGHGLYNMQQRADSIDAELEITTARPGTRVRLCLPYISDTPSASLAGDHA